MRSGSLHQKVVVATLRHHYQQAGRKGGKATLKAHGAEHMRRIGQAGFTATCDRHYGGDRRAMLNELIRRGLRALDPCPWNGVWQNFTAFPDPPKGGGRRDEG